MWRSKLEKFVALCVDNTSAVPEPLQVMRREIGRGSIGVVALGRWRETDVAIKILEGPPDETVRDKRREVDPALRRAMEKEVGPS